MKLFTIVVLAAALAASATAAPKHAPKAQAVKLVSNVFMEYLSVGWDRGKHTQAIGLKLWYLLQGSPTGNEDNVKGMQRMYASTPIDWSESRHSSVFARMSWADARFTEIVA